MRLAIAIAGLAGAGLLAAPPELQAEGARGSDAFDANFDDGRMEGWWVVGGEWRAVGGALRQTSASWGRHIAFTRVRLEAGAVQARARVDVPDGTSGASLGFVFRCHDGRDDVYLRCGAYGRTQLGDATIAPFVPVVGRTYALRAEIEAGRVTVRVDGNAIGSAAMPNFDAPGYVGFYTECQATFDDFVVTGDWRHEPLFVEPEGAVPELDVAFTEWAPMTLDPRCPVSVNGAVFVYYRNVGGASAEIDSVRFAGREVDPQRLPEDVLYVRQQPARLGPGDVGRLELRVRGLPAEIGLRLVENVGRPVEVPIVVRPGRGAAAEAAVDLMGGHLPLAINFFAFSADLRTVYLYVQNNTARLVEAGGPITIVGVEIDGVDLTEAARFGTRTVGTDVVPIEVALPEPLVRGRPVRVVVTTASGGRTGHVLRAFPSKFNILVSTFSNQARLDFMEDIHCHGATALNGTYDAAKFGELGFDLLPMMPRSPGFLGIALWHRDEPIAGVWVDEVDKPWGRPVSRLLDPLVQAERYLAATGAYVPLQCFNVIATRDGAVTGHMTVSDAVMHSYGYHMCSTRGLGRADDLPFREYRLSRRPFWPYFRDGEIPVPRDPEAGTVLPLSKSFQRCLTPAEARWIQFGTLLQGAKSFCHWGYWSKPGNGFYYIEEPILRIGLGGIAGASVGPYRIHPEVVGMLGDVWDEIGRINAEVRTIGPLVARSDVSYLARVSRVTPATNPRGAPAAEAAALVCGLDTIIVLALNHDLDVGETPFPATGGLSNPRPPAFPPVDAVVDVRVPPWLEAKHVFSVDHAALRDVAPPWQADERVLRFRIPRLEVSRIYVVTSSDAVRDGCVARHHEMQGLLARMARSEPVPDPRWRE